MNEVVRKMDTVVAAGQSSNWSQSQYKSALSGIIASERQGLRAGHVALNVNQRPWAK